MSELDDLFWRDEILQAMFWLHGEGLADSVDPVEISRVLAADESVVFEQLGNLLADGYLERFQGHLHPSALPSFRLTDLGRREGGRRFKDEFGGLTRQAHGECAPGCVCHDPDHLGQPCPNRKPERVPS